MRRLGRVRAAGATGQLTVRADQRLLQPRRRYLYLCNGCRLLGHVPPPAERRTLIEADPGHCGLRQMPYGRTRRTLSPRRPTPRSSSRKTAVRLTLRRVKPTPGSSSRSSLGYSDHAFITDRARSWSRRSLTLRRHAEIENAIRDPQVGVGLHQSPLARLAANAAWLAVQLIAHNLARWTATAGARRGNRDVQDAQAALTIAEPDWLTVSDRRRTAPRRRPWAGQWASALARLRAVPLPS